MDKTTTYTMSETEIRELVSAHMLSKYGVEGSLTLHKDSFGYYSASITKMEKMG